MESRTKYIGAEEGGFRTGDPASSNMGDGHYAYSFPGQDYSVLVTPSGGRVTARRSQLKKLPEPMKATNYAKCNLGQWTGTDPELFVLDENGSPIPAFRFLPDKFQPHTHDHGGVFWDGYQAEMTVKPSHCHVYLVDHITYNLVKLYQLATQHNPGARLSCTTSIDVTQEQLDAVRAENPEYAALLCDPSMSAYGHKPINPQAGADKLFRCAGFHVHLEGIFRDPAKTCRTIDGLAGVLSVAVLRGLEDTRRRTLYGMAGEYRLPEHGIEYRTLSSAVLVKPQVTHLMLDLVRFAAIQNELGFGDSWKRDAKTERIINEYDVEGALAYVRRNKQVIELILRSMYAGSWEFASKIIEDGAKSMFGDDMMKNWALPCAGKAPPRKTIQGSTSDVH